MPLTPRAPNRIARFNCLVLSKQFKMAPVSGDDSEGRPSSPSPLSESEAKRVLSLLDATTGSSDLRPALLTQGDVDQLVNEVFSDEIHVQHS